MTENRTRIIDSISAEIFYQLRLAAGEQRHPGAGSDQSDDTIKEALSCAKKLRVIREDLENIFTGVLL